VGRGPGAPIGWRYTVLRGECACVVGWLSSAVSGWVPGMWPATPWPMAGIPRRVRLSAGSTGWLVRLRSVLSVGWPFGLVRGLPLRLVRAWWPSGKVATVGWYRVGRRVVDGFVFGRECGVESFVHHVCGMACVGAKFVAFAFGLLEGGGESDHVAGALRGYPVNLGAGERRLRPDIEQPVGAFGCWPGVSHGRRDGLGLRQGHPGHCAPLRSGPRMHRVPRKAGIGGLPARRPRGRRRR
jgi:hypothetical protein